MPRFAPRFPAGQTTSHPLRVELQNRVIAITGASSGIGLATALACARAGMSVVAAARRTDKLNSLVEQIRAERGRAIAVSCDVTSPDDCERLIEIGAKEFGPLHAVFANAGYGLERAVHVMTERECRDIFETNFFGTMNTIRPAVSHMLAQGAGHLLICSSCLAKLAVPTVGAYCATKAAQDHIARAMRIELKAKGIAVSSVHPIGTKTELFDEMAKRSQSGDFARTPASLMQPPSVVADRVVACLRRPRPEVWTSTLARLGFAAADLSPRLVDWLLEKRFSSKTGT